MPETGRRIDPYRAFNFIVSIVGLKEAVSFSECTGIGSTTEVVDGPRPLGGVGGGTAGLTKLPGKTTFSDITLKWGVTDSTELWDWRQDVINGKVFRRNGSIVIFDLDNHTEVARWNFVNAWPSKWEGPALNQKGDIAIATLVLAHEGLTSLTTRKG
jgi:phage tail-like protein